ncbi:adenosylcobinamide-GDP ribazoletransferase [Tropicimonas marinistellae]|uniref:adenosylcobinamide-GDP ribazoletransferase n=1 Tax=Tropicimonas marinistellae TaxID=1739787 RepID=UPI000829565A|nr:adenosylcobinamide-GDP ribazoletransferase [Tropicimonas marinistellae]
MTSRPTPLRAPLLRDLALGLGLLTRLPLPVDSDYARARGARAAWAYPLAGVPVALAAWGVAWAALALGLPAGIAAGLALAAQVMLTGAMHEDGLADSADGLWGGWDPARRLEIMKDSRIGSYGVLALILGMGLRWSALAALCSGPGAGLLPALLAAAVLSRAAMVALMAGLPNAREGGLSRAVGRPGAGRAVLAAALALGLSVAVLGWQALVLAGAVCAATLGAAAIARAKIGGQTGDILGATQQVAEIAALAAAAAHTG